MNWTDKEIEQIKNGVVPRGRTLRQCIAKAHADGIPWRRSPIWSKSEVSILKQGGIPENRTHGDIRKYCRRHGIPLPAGVVEKDKPGRKMETWTDGEIELLKKDILPEGRTRNECLYYCRRYLGKGFKPHQAYYYNKRGERFYKLYESGLTYTEIGKMFDLSRQFVQNIISRYLEQIKKL